MLYIASFLAVQSFVNNLKIFILFCIHRFSYMYGANTLEIFGKITYHISTQLTKLTRDLHKPAHQLTHTNMSCSSLLAHLKRVFGRLTLHNGYPACPEQNCSVSHTNRCQLQTNSFEGMSE